MAEISRYNFKEIEIKWQNYWEKNNFFLLKIIHKNQNFIV